MRVDLSETLPAMKAHGVPWLRKFFRGEISRDAGCGRRDHGHAPLRQAAGHVVSQPDAGLDLGETGGGDGAVGEGA